MLNLEEVAKRYQVTTKTIYRWRRAKAFPKPIKIGKGLRWHVEVLEVWEKTGQPALMKIDEAEMAEVKAEVKAEIKAGIFWPGQDFFAEEIQEEIALRIFKGNLKGNLKTAFSSMSKRQAKCRRLHLGLGIERPLEIKEIADFLGITRQAVGKHLVAGTKRAKKRAFLEKKEKK